MDLDGTAVEGAAVMEASYRPASLVSRATTAMTDPNRVAVEVVVVNPCLCNPLEGGRHYQCLPLFLPLPPSPAVSAHATLDG